MTAPAGDPPAASRSVRLLVAGGVATVVIGFVVGFLLGGRGPGPSTDTVTAAGSSTSIATTTSSTTAPSTSAPTTTEPAPSSTTGPSTTAAPVPTTEAPTTTSVVVPTTVVTLPPPTTVAPTFAPSRVVVSYGADASGRLVVPRTGSATLVITNEGGLAQQWLVTGTGFTTIGATQGTLGPGQTVTVSIVAPLEELPLGEVPGIISVLGAVNPTIAFVIPPA